MLPVLPSVTGRDSNLIRMLDLTPGGSVPVPPMVPEIHGLLLAVVLAVLAASVVGSALFSAVLARRDQPADVLRLGA